MSVLSPEIIKSGVEINNVIGTYGNDRIALIAISCDKSASVNGVCFLRFKWDSDPDFSEKWDKANTNVIFNDLEPGTYNCVFSAGTRWSTKQVIVNNVEMGAGKITDYATIDVTDTLTINFIYDACGLLIYKANQ